MNVLDCMSPSNLNSANFSCYLILIWFVRTSIYYQYEISCSWDPVPCIQLSAVIHYWILVHNSKLFCSGPNVFSPLKIAFRPMAKMFWSYEKTIYYLLKKNLCVQPILFIVLLLLFLIQLSSFVIIGYILNCKIKSPENGHMFPLSFQILACYQTPQSCLNDSTS